MMKYLGFVLALMAAGATTAAMAGSKRHMLPEALTFPEGIAFDRATQTIYTAASPDGVIARVNSKTGAVRVVQSPEVREQLGQTFPGILGLKIDARGRLWMAGGRTGKVFVVDPRSGRLIQTITPPEAEKGLINDIAFAGGKAFLTDTLRPTLWAVDAGENIPAEPEAFVQFEGTPLKYDSGPNLNGIVATPDGRSVITGQMNKGLLFRIDVASRQVTPIDLKGQLVEGVDGLVLTGSTLYVIRQPAAEIVTVRLAPDLSWGGVIKRTRTEGLQWPATGVIVDDELVVVNTQFNKRASSDPERPFSLQRIALGDLQ